MLFGHLITYSLLTKLQKKIYYDDSHSNFYLYGRGFLGIGVTYTWYEGIISINLGDAVSIVLLCPVFVVLLAGLFLGEKVKWREMTAALLGFIGVTFITKPPMLLSFLG